MTKLLTFAFGFALGSALGIVQAAPFLTGDPYPPTAPQPDTFLITVSTTTTTPPTSVTSLAVKNPDGSVVLKWDLAGVGAGLQTVRVRAKNAWGESVDSAPFTFTAGKPATASGLRLVASESGSTP